MNLRDGGCQRCGEILNPKKRVALELNCRTNLYTDPNKTKVPEIESQGIFYFGRACAAAVLANGGVNEPPAPPRSVDRAEHNRAVDMAISLLFSDFQGDVLMTARLIGDRVKLRRQAYAVTRDQLRKGYTKDDAAYSAAEQMKKSYPAPAGTAQ